MVQFAASRGSLRFSLSLSLSVHPLALIFALGHPPLRAEHEPSSTTTVPLLPFTLFPSDLLQLAPSLPYLIARPASPFSEVNPG